MPKPPFLAAFCLFGFWTIFGLFSVQAGELSFSAPLRLTILSWSDKAIYGVPANGAQWLVVDSRGRFWLEADKTFDLYGPSGHYLKKLNPFDESQDFYGFDSMEALGDGRIILLERLESRAEQLAGDNFELRSKPGVRLVVLAPDGKVEADKEEVDPIQPHSDYILENGNVYAIHNDGTCQILDSIGSFPKDRVFKEFAAATFSPDSWLNHLKTLPVFRSESRVYHDILGKAHVHRDAQLFLMGHFFVEGVGPLAERDGKIYYRIVCFENGGFVDYVFVEDLIRGQYAIIELIGADKKMGAVRDHALFVDEKGNLFEGVAKKEGYRIIEWKISKG
jgi:hypothetical protein